MSEPSPSSQAEYRVQHRRPSFGFARRNGITIVEWHSDGAAVACREDVSPIALAEIRRFAGCPVKLQTLGADDYEALIQRMYERSGGDAQAMVADLGDESDLGEAALALAEPADLLESEDDAPIIRLINAMVTQAVKDGASDIHIEPFESRLAVRYRIDGVLQQVLSPPASLANLIVSRIKVMARLDIAERRLPQDGRISLRVAGRPVDVRVSTLPSGHGERVVLRLLDKQAGRLDLEQLGMNPDMLTRLTSLIQRPHGIILVTGPTGSGKTTTLYAALAMLNDASRNIMTVEDPIEYYIDGIGQTQVNTKVDLTFARGLRAILRQDPDVVMVGEIRDLETAEIAVQASLTGHLVLSTLHTNSASGAATRLRDMGIEPFLLSSSLIGVLSQRLVRQLDTQTRVPYTASPADCRAFGMDQLQPAPTLFRAGSTEGQSGYRGRTGIYELLVVDDGMRELIHDGASEQRIEQATRAQSPGILEDGWNKALAGITTLEEVLRVTRDD